MGRKTKKSKSDMKYITRHRDGWRVRLNLKIKTSMDEFQVEKSDKCFSSLFDARQFRDNRLEIKRDEDKKIKSEIYEGFRPTTLCEATAMLVYKYGPKPETPTELVGSNKQARKVKLWTIGTLHHYQQMINRICQEFGSVYMHTVKSHDWEDFLDHSQESRKWSPRTYNQFRSFIKALYAEGMKQRIPWCPVGMRNPIESIEEMANSKPYQSKTLRTHKQMSEFLYRAEKLNPTIGIAFNVILSTGARVGEALGLLRKDIHFYEDREGGFIDINKQLLAKHNVYAPPKADSVRKSEFSPECAAALRAWLDRVPGNEDSPLLVWTESGRSAKRGQVISHRTLLKASNRICDEMGIPRVKVHGLRHTCGTQNAIQYPDRLHAISQSLGHKSMKQTLHYLKTTNDLQQGRIYLSIPTFDEKSTPTSGTLGPKPGEEGAPKRTPMDKMVDKFVAKSSHRGS